MIIADTESLKCFAYWRLIDVLIMDAFEKNFWAAGVLRGLCIPPSLPSHINTDDAFWQPQFSYPFSATSIDITLNSLSSAPTPSTFMRTRIHDLRDLQVVHHGRYINIYRTEQSTFKEFRVMPDDTEAIAQFDAVKTLNITTLWMFSASHLY
ncbi:hypothetical protein PILCRDRAFT_344295 [Piloderma croceum F 1598]|uniref:Uncharacterized protein n=1 Tax=Piloderma croceum (strain F 1598) TaxID=765440 RepID=A0A0C3BHI5_PILCF|nr:hypothetical protein PILCRDRAFT_344295 [Piloderma croceum F 1598]